MSILNKTLKIHRGDLVGDFMMSVPSLRAYKKQHPDHTIVYAHSPGIGMGELAKRCPLIDVVEEREAEPGDIDLCCSKAFGWGAAHNRSMQEGFCVQLGVPFDGFEMEYEPTQEDRDGAKVLADRIGKPFALMARHSFSCTSYKGEPANKCFINREWIELGKQLVSMSIEPVAIGTLRDKEHIGFKDWPWTTIYGEPLTHVAALLELSRGCITVDTGMRFLACAVGANFLVISCATPSWLVSARPQKEGQIGVELNIPVLKVFANNLALTVLEVFSLPCLN